MYEVEMGKFLENYKKSVISYDKMDDILNAIDLIVKGIDLELTNNIKTFLREYHNIEITNNIYDDFRYGLIKIINSIYDPKALDISNKLEKYFDDKIKHLYELKNIGLILGIVFTVSFIGVFTSINSVFSWIKILISFILFLFLIIGFNISRFNRLSVKKIININLSLKIKVYLH